MSKIIRTAWHPRKQHEFTPPSRLPPPTSAAWTWRDVAHSERIMSIFVENPLPYDPLPHWLVLRAVALSFLLLLYLAYYRVFAVRRPRVACASADLLAALKTHCPVLFEEFWPTVWAPQAHMQTIVRVAIQTFPRSERRRYVARPCPDCPEMSQAVIYI